MQSVYDTLYNWARRTTTSFADLDCAGPGHAELPALTGPVYRLKHWPELPPHHRTADVFRALSVMSNCPINRRWILTHSRICAAQLDSLLERLVREGAVEAIDVAGFPLHAPIARQAVTSRAVARA